MLFSDTCGEPGTLKYECSRMKRVSRVISEAMKAHMDLNIIDFCTTLKGKTSQCPLFRIN